MNDQAYRKGEKEVQELPGQLNRYRYLCIYSAGNRAKEIIQMRKLGLLDIRKPNCFLVTERGGNMGGIDNPYDIDGIPVYTLREYTAAHDASVNRDTAVLVAAMEHYHPAIHDSLTGNGFGGVFYLTDIMERILIARSMARYYGRLGIPFHMTAMRVSDCLPGQAMDIGVPDTLMTYMVQCAQDAELEEERAYRNWVEPIQAGAALTAERNARITDADGENISAKNAYYNEMTALYWLWKNTDILFSGICHYRRQFESDAALEPLLGGEADAVLPVPALVYPDLRGYYINWGEEAYYDMMLQVVRELEPDYYETAVWCARHGIFYPNNIFIAKRKVLEDYCQFAFRILDGVEMRMESRGGKKQKRCWLSEHVTTIYFMKHCRDYKIVFSNLRRFW